MTRTLPTSRARLAVLPISATEWRISDPARRSDDALCLVGFVQRIDDVYETTQIGLPLVRRYFPSLAEAVDHLATSRR